MNLPNNMNQFPKGLLQPLFISAKIFPLNKKNTLSATIIAPIEIIL